jgi:hypothetical protein
VIVHFWKFSVIVRSTRTPMKRHLDDPLRFNNYGQLYFKKPDAKSCLMAPFHRRFCGSRFREQLLSLMISTRGFLGSLGGGLCGFLERRERCLGAAAYLDGVRGGGLRF